MSSLDIRYITGLFDGEGSVTINKRTRKGKIVFSIWVAISNCNPFVLSKIKDLHGGQIHKREGVNYPNYQLTISNKAAYLFLKQMQPHSQIKINEINIAIDFYDTVIGKFKNDPFTRINLCTEFKNKLKESRYKWES